MELIDFMKRQNIYITLNILHAEDMTAHIKHTATILKMGFIIYLYSGNSHNAASNILGRSNLQQALQAIENSSLGATCNPNARFGNVEQILLRS